MLPYWYLSFFFIVMIFFDVYLRNDEVAHVKYNKQILLYLYILSVIVLIFFGGIRGAGTGVDDSMYRITFSEIEQKSVMLSIGDIINQYKYEPITTIVMMAVSIFTKNADIFIFAYLLISVFINSYTYKKYSPLFLISLAVYSSHLYLNKDLNQIRFGLSSALFVLSMCYLHENKYTKSIIFIVMAALSHQTALAGVVMYLVRPFVKWKYMPFLIVLICIPLGFLGGKNIFGWAFGYLPQIVSNYQGTEFDTEIPLVSVANIKNVFFVFIFCFFLLDKNGKLSTEQIGLSYILILVYAIGAGVRMVFHDFSIIGGRVGNLFLHVEPLLISLLCFRLIKYRFLMVIFIVSIIMYYFYYNTIANPQSLMGYKVSDTFNIY